MMENDMIAAEQWLSSLSYRSKQIVFDPFCVTFLDIDLILFGEVSERGTI